MPESVQLCAQSKQLIFASRRQSITVLNFLIQNASHANRDHFSHTTASHFFLMAMTVDPQLQGKSFIDPSGLSGQHPKGVILPPRGPRPSIYISQPLSPAPSINTVLLTPKLICSRIMSSCVQDLRSKCHYAHNIARGVILQLDTFSHVANIRADSTTYLCRGWGA